jgi:enamine deaminase RidA (YjgF/YER057c/UK114 family)
MDVRDMAEAAGVEEAEIRDLNSQIRRVYKNMKNLLTECKMSMIRQDSYTKAAQYN